VSTDDPERKDEPAELPDEPRAKDLFTRPRAELEEAMDPATLAQLSSWFEMPNLADVEEAEAVAEMQTAEDRELQELYKRRDAACAAADPAFVKHIERHERAELAIAPAFAPAPIVDETIVNVAVRAQLERQSADEPVSELREYEAPYDIMDITRKHNAPQAILRDLYRPATDFAKIFVSPFDEIPHLDHRREAREAIRERIKIEWIEPTFEAGMAVRTEARAILRAPWTSYWELFQTLKMAREDSAENASAAGSSFRF
jgi:hypothetical protein